MNKFNQISIIIGAVILGFFLGVIYVNYKKDQLITNPKIQKSSDTFVSVSQNGELILMDSESGRYLIFEDSVGIKIFNHYASYIYKK